MTENEIVNRRYELQELLEDVLGCCHVYFQPPASVKMHYPAIIYSLSAIENTPADNLKYLLHKRYQVTLIDKDPDTKTVDKIVELPLCRFDRRYVSDNMNHFVFELYY